MLGGATPMTTEISAHDAQMRLPEFLRQAEAGQRFTITDYREAVAARVPCEAASRTRPQPIATA